MKSLPIHMFNELFTLIKSEKYQLIGPVVKDGVVSYEPVQSVSDLPRGIIDHQSPGDYSIEQTSSDNFFNYTQSPFSWKKYLTPPQQTLFKTVKKKNTLTFETPADDEALAFLGVRSCELSAIEVQDAVYMNGAYTNPFYKSGRKKNLLIAVECSRSCDTCFCHSLGTGPDINKGVDIILTEIEIEGQHFFLVRTGSDKGEEIISKLDLETSTDHQKILRDAQLERVRSSQNRHVKVSGLKSTLYESTDHPQWGRAARRCLACSNCTMVCPTCFCMTVEDINDLEGNSERRERWDSCFTSEFTYIHGGNVRESVKSRYRHWLTHKFASWQDQFDRLGCVGCGRCITWCPAGIDITEEIAELSKTSETEPGEVANYD